MYVFDLVLVGHWKHERRTVQADRRRLFEAKLSQNRTGDCCTCGRKGAVMSTRWVCDFCGNEGSTASDVPSDQIQCPMCGEPVTPLPFGGNATIDTPRHGLAQWAR
jgi:ribosomal protein S27E